jgi:hypothetical protein
MLVSGDPLAAMGTPQGQLSDQKRSLLASHGAGRCCRGFRMTAPITGLSTGTGAVVRKPSGKEPAGCGPQRCRGRYGDFNTAAEDAAADDVAGGMIAEPHGGSDGARLAGQQGSEADPRLAGCWLGRALSRPVLDQRDRSEQQWRMTLPELMRCRSRWRRASRPAGVAQARLP